ncbi:FtsW/RodA/SpoVE family cell cycle protein [Oscillibacter hominis]|nr:FtsW/RodA/SpoVE family cell cycle protein [Oscillibacter hominis]
MPKDNEMERVMFTRLKSIISDFIQQADLVLLALCCTATCYGLALIYSATRYKDTYRYVVVQAAALCIGILCYIFFSMVDIEELSKKWKWLVAFNVVFILLLIPFGKEVYGNRAWVHFPGMPVNIGPAEFIKITFSILLSRQLQWLQEEKRDLKSISAIAFIGGHTILLCGYYYVISSDMGNALVYVFIFICMAFAAGVALRWFVLAFAAAGGGITALWAMDLIPSYMKERFIVLFDHSYDPLGKGWQQTRSLLALGSGQLTGQGFLNGTQTQARYDGSLPARWTDFIFSVAGEELGMLGCLGIILILAAIIVRCLMVAKRAKTRMSAYICVGMAAMLIFQTVENIGMCLFVMPVIGLTLPFFSYGGSSVVTLFCAMGVVSGIKKRSLPDWLRNR